MANPAPTINQINAFNATQGTTIDFNIIGGTELVRSNRIYIYDLSDNSLICTHLYVSTESIHELPPNTDGSIVYESGKSSADFVNGAQYYAQIQTFTDIGGTEGGSGLSVAKMFWCLDDPTLTIDTIPSTISTTSYNVSATYDANTSVVSNIIQQYQFSLYSATGSLLQSSGVVVGNGEQQGTSTAYDISYNFTGLSVGSSYYVVVDVTTTQGMSVSTQSGTFTVSIDTPTLGEATVVNNACDGYISVTSNLSSEYGGSGSGDIVSFETDSENVFSKLQVTFQPTQSGTGTPSPSNVRPIYGVGGVTVYDSPTEDEEDAENYTQEFDVSLTPTSKDTEPYLFKAVGDIYGDRLEEDIVGGTVNWNQLVQNGNFESASLWTNGFHVTGLSIANGIATYTATGTYAQIRSNFSTAFLANHVYMSLAVAKASTARKASLGTMTLGQNYADIGTSYTMVGSVKKPSTSFTDAFLFVVSTAVDGDVINVKSLQCFDLTAMFGSTIADYVYSLEQATTGSGIAWLKSYGFFTKPYYDYDTGTLKSVNPTAHVTRGVNAWDEEIELGRIDVSNGENVTATDRLRSKNYVQVIPNTTYYFSCQSLNGYPSANVYGYLYDANKTYLRAVNINNTTISIPSDCHYIRFMLGGAYGTTFKNDVCINISDPTINGKYFPYEEHTYDLGNVPLYGLFQLENNKLKAYGDVRHADGGTDRKFTLVDLGTLNYTLQSTGRFYATLPVLAKPTGSYNTKANLLCEKYDNITQNQLFDGTKGIATQAINGDTVYIYDTAYADAASLKTAMSGVYLLYEKATTTTEQTPPFTQIQEVSKYGTLEYITSNDVPVGHNTTYLTRDIFGGYIDLVSGQLTVDRVYADLGTLTWSEEIDGVYSTGALVGQIKEPLTNTEVPNILCSQYVPASYIELWSEQLNGSITVIWSASGVHGKIWVRDSRFTDAQSFKTAMNGVQLVYELATPLTYQLTPQHINTLVGVNNVWSEQGNIELSYHIPITNLLVKRQDVDDVSGNWLTLYSQPVEQASDMDFTFIDFLNQYGKTYKYALVPLLTQTQSGVEVEVEGGYTVSDEVQSIFDGVFISDSTGSQKCKANVGYGNVNMNQSVGSITPIGSQYPIIVTNSNNRYHNGSISGMIVPDDYYYNGNLSRIDMVNKRNELEQFLTNKRVKIIKDWNSNIWLVMIMDNIDCSFDNNYGMGIVTFNANWLEVGDPTNQEDLQATGLVNVGGV